MSLKMSRKKKDSGGLDPYKDISGGAKYGLISADSSRAAYPWHGLSPEITEYISDKGIEISGAQDMGKKQKFDWISVVLQPLGALLVIVILLVVLKLTGAGMSMGLYMMIGSVSGVLGILWGVLRFRSDRKKTEAEQSDNQEKYREYIREKKDEIKKAADLQRRIMEKNTPSAGVCAKMDENDPLLWCRDFSSRNYLCLRLGSGKQKLRREIRAPEKDYRDENELNDLARKLAETNKYVSGSPIFCNLRKYCSMGIAGQRQDCIAQIKNIIVTAAALHSYEELKIVLIYPEKERNIWEGLRFLPHFKSGDGKVRYLAPAGSAAKLLESIVNIINERSRSKTGFGISSDAMCCPHFLVIIADGSALSGTSTAGKLCVDDVSLGISSVFTAQTVERLPGKCRLISELEGEKAVLYDKEDAGSGNRLSYIPDVLESGSWEHFTKTMAAVRLENPTASGGIPESVSFLEGCGVTEPRELPIRENWAKNRPEKSMNVLIGQAQAGNPFYFDISSKASGPHGIVVGSSGSGKSSMLRSWVLSMALNFSPEKIAFVLVDFKPPGLFHVLEKLPHVAGTLGILDTDIERNLVALKSEIARRERIFSSSSSNNIYNYLQKHYSGKPEAAENMQFLYVIVDELNEFKMRDQEMTGGEWMKLLDKLYQTGNSLGIYIICGSQNIVPFDQIMESNAQFRWCLKTNTAEDSRYMLKSDCAYEISAKGRSFITVGSSIQELQPLFADGAYLNAGEIEQTPERQLALIDSDGRLIKTNDKDKHYSLESEKVVEFINSFASRNKVQPARRIWPDRLPEKLWLNELPPAKTGGLQAVVGFIDDPGAQSQYPCVIELKKTGSFLVYGAAQTGKTSFLRSFALSIMSSNSPEELEVYMLEDNSGEFEGFEAFPHTAAVADFVNAGDILGKVSAELKLRRSGRSERKNTILLIIDNLNSLMSDYKKEIMDIVQLGAGCKIFLLGSAYMAASEGSTYSVDNLTKTGVSFWISQDKSEYKDRIHNREVNFVPPDNIPGRGILNAGSVLSFQTALPSRPVSEIIQDIVKKNWPHYKKQQRIYSESLPEGSVYLGKGADLCGSVKHDFMSCHSLLIIGDDLVRRRRVMESAAEQLINGMELKDCIFVGSGTDFGRDIAGLRQLHEPRELEDYLSDMKDELLARSSAYADGGKFPPYLFVFEDLKASLDSADSKTKRRIDTNLIKSGSALSIFCIAGISYSDYEQLYSAEEKEISDAEADGRETVPLTRLSVASCLLMKEGIYGVHRQFKNRYDIAGEHNYYLGISKAEIIKELKIRGEIQNGNEAQ